LTGLGPRRCAIGDRQAPACQLAPLGGAHARCSMPAALRAQLSDEDLTARQRRRSQVRRGLPDPAATARAIALAVCEVEAGLRSASQLERVCHHNLWQAVADRVQRAGGPPVSAASVLRVQVQELTPGLADAVAVVRRGQRAV
jgi:hypothetical protein